ncbi:MAG: DUF1194 domain-containing protein [Pirellulales bacterium]|nr:DUF1194 domain-containing protein [Pirellulales bacterium]
MRSLMFAVLVGIVALGFGGQYASAAVDVDLELSLLSDVSGSMSTAEFDLVRNGYAAAFNNAATWTKISQGTLGKIAVNLVYWSGANQQSEVVPWTLIDSFAAAQAFATAVTNAARPFSGNTAPGSAINFDVPLFASNNYDGTRQVIDVSGDGSQNEGANTATARDDALTAGIDQINGLAIGDATLVAWYNANVKGGAGAFVSQASTFAAFEAAVLEKIQIEVVGGVPEPATIVIWSLLGTFATLFVLKRKSKAA